MAGKTLADAIAFNEANAAREMPYFGQELFELADSIDISSPDAPQPAFGGMTYNQALDIDQAAGATNGIDAALTQFQIDAIATPTGTPAWTTDVINGDHFTFATSQLAAIVGYPIINVPMGNVFGLPVGLSFIGTAFSEPTLIALGSGFEHEANARIVPQLFPTLPLEERERCATRPPARPRRRAEALAPSQHVGCVHPSSPGPPRSQRWRPAPLEHTPDICDIVRATGVPMKRFMISCAASIALCTALSAASVKFTSTWKSPDAGSVSFAGKKVAALVISKDESLRMSGEEALVRELTARGLEGVATYRIAPKEELRDADRAKVWYEKANVEGVVAIRPVSADTRQSYTPGTWINLVLQYFYGLLRLWMGKRVRAWLRRERNSGRRGEHDLQRAPKRAPLGCRERNDEPQEPSAVHSEPREGIRQGTTETGARQEPEQVSRRLPEDSSDSEDYSPATVEPDARAEQHGTYERVEHEPGADVCVPIDVLVAVEHSAVLEPRADEHRTPHEIGEPSDPAHASERDTPRSDRPGAPLRRTRRARTDSPA